MGAQRALPRLRLASLAEQVMLHSRRYRAESCRGLMARIEALLAAEGPSRGQALARDRRDVLGTWPRATRRSRRGTGGRRGQPFERADAAARAAKRNRLYIETLGFRALILHRCGEDRGEPCTEAVELAKVYGLRAGIR